MSKTQTIGPRSNRMPKVKKLPADYEERVYAGVLGKLIGVYLGRPFEQWTHERIKRELGDITYYVHERLNKPLVVTDDDISGTFTFIRALEDFGYSKNLTAEQIGQTWLNYIIEQRTILWWGGMGASTEHTAFQRLKRGIPAPRSGSIELNGQVVAEQIGSQIFIDGWGIVAPGDPEMAAEFARRASSVSHDGEAIYGAQVVAAMEAQAFVERDMDKLFDTALKLIPDTCTIRRLIDDIRGWSAKDGDWERTFSRIQGRYSYAHFGGGCHMVPNHAIIVLALAYAPDDFHQAQLIANTAGWDTDCNAGNVGCLLGIKLGLAGLEAGPDWRGPIADRLFLPTADGGRCVSDAVQEARTLIRAGRALHHDPAPEPKNGARYHFEFPGAVQGFRLEDSPECKCVGAVWNAVGHSKSGTRSLAIGFAKLAPGRCARVATPVFLLPEDAKMPGYGLIASPTLYSGQTLRGAVECDAQTSRAVTLSPYIRHYGPNDSVAITRGPEVKLAPGARKEFEWRIPALGGQPIAEVGVEISGAPRADGTVYLDYLSWDGAPDVAFKRPESGVYYQRAWVNAADQVSFGRGEEEYSVLHDEGPGLLIQGTREWAHYGFSARTNPHLAAAAGIAVCVQGLKRYYALVLSQPNTLKLVKEYYGRQTLAEVPFPWKYDEPVELSLRTIGGKLSAYANGKRLITVEDKLNPLMTGAVALICDEGRTYWTNVKVQPV